MPITYPVTNTTFGTPSPALDALQKLQMRQSPHRLTEPPPATPMGEVPISEHILNSLKMAYGAGRGATRESHPAPRLQLEQ